MKCPFCSYTPTSQTNKNNVSTHLYNHLKTHGIPKCPTYGCSIDELKTMTLCVKHFKECVKQKCVVSGCAEVMSDSEKFDHYRTVHNMNFILLTKNGNFIEPQNTNNIVHSHTNIHISK